MSLDDNLLRIFGGDRVANLMNAFRVDEDMPIESGMLTRSLESAQKKVPFALKNLQSYNSQGLQEETVAFSPNKRITRQSKKQ